MADEEKDKKEGEEGEGKQTPPAASKSNKTMIIAIVGVVVLLIIIAVGAFFFIQSTKSNDTLLGADAASSSDDESLEAQAGVSEDELEEDDASLGAIFPFETIVVNLSGGSFLRCQIQLEFLGRDIPKRFYSKLTPIKDTIITTLASKRREDIANKEGRDDLKSILREVINDLLKREEIKNVYFTQFLIQ